MPTVVAAVAAVVVVAAAADFLTPRGDPQRVFQ